MLRYWVPLLGVGIIVAGMATAATDPIALQICKETGNLKNTCLGVIKGQAFQREGLMVCDELLAGSGKVRCLQIVAGDTLDVEMLKTCDAEVSDWSVLDCLKQVSNKTPEQLQFRITASLTQPFWAKNFASAPAVWTAIERQAQNALAAGSCNGYRYLLPADENWKQSSCWSSVQPMPGDAYPPVADPSDQYAVGSTQYNHCALTYQCVTE